MLLFTGLITGIYGFILAILMGFGMAGIGMCVMHDANHGAYSSKPKVNDFLGICIYLIGGDVIIGKFNIIFSTIHIPILTA